MAAQSPQFLSQTPARKLPLWGLVAVLIVLAAFAARFVHSSVLYYLMSYDPAAYEDMWPRRFGLIPHMLGGTLALTAGLAQIWLGLTGRTGSLHRALGRLYVVGIVVGSGGAFYLAATIPAGSNHFVYAAGLSGLACAWVLTTGMALISIRRRAIEQHREWMLRSYTVTFAFVTFRLFDQILAHWKVAPAADIDAFMAFACWAFPLLLAEPLIQLRRLSRG
jgi:uncharacterized membrane protein YozB (DUF420 family)